MSAFPAGVTIVTAKGERDTPQGVTVSAFASISLEPPLIMVSLRSTSRTAAAIHVRKAFAVHILDGSHAELATTFSQNGTDKFRGVSYSWTPGGLPILDACPLHLECSLEDERSGGRPHHLAGAGGTRPFARKCGREPHGLLPPVLPLAGAAGVGVRASPVCSEGCGGMQSTW